MSEKLLVIQLFVGATSAIAAFAGLSLGQKGYWWTLGLGGAACLAFMVLAWKHFD